MGYYKELEIERMNDPFYDLDEHSVGVSCFNNNLLIDFIKQYGSKGVCSYTGKEEVIIGFKSIVEKIFEISTTYFSDAANEAGWYRELDEDGKVPGFTKLGGGYVVPDNKTHYETSEELLIGEGLEIGNEQLLNDISKAIPDNIYVEKDIYGLNDAEIRQIDWQEIERQTPKWETRNLPYTQLPIADRTRLFNLLETIQSLGHRILIDEDLHLFRTVKYKDKLTTVLFTNLTSPPIEYTQDLRMSPKGISMFYGASTSHCAQVEAIGHEKGYYYVGEFESKRKLTLLDLRRLKTRTSIFDIPEDDYYAVVFLQNFAKRISKPIRDGWTQEYIPTQFITAYFKNSLYKYYGDGTKRNIDGILYDSSKISNAYNVVLFYDNTTSASVLNLISYQMIDKTN